MTPSLDFELILIFHVQVKIYTDWTIPMKKSIRTNVGFGDPMQPLLPSGWNREDCILVTPFWFIKSAWELHSCFSPSHTFAHNDKSESLTMTIMNACLSHNLPYIVYFDIDICVTMNNVLFRSLGFCDYRTITIVTSC